MRHAARPKSDGFEGGAAGRLEVGEAANGSRARGPFPARRGERKKGWEGRRQRGTADAREATDGLGAAISTRP